MAAPPATPDQHGAHGSDAPPSSRGDDDPARSYQAVKLPSQVRRRLRMWAGFQGKEISALVEEAITRHLDALDREREQRGLQPLPRPEV